MPATFSCASSERSSFLIGSGAILHHDLWRRCRVAGDAAAAAATMKRLVKEVLAQTDRLDLHEQLLKSAVASGHVELVKKCQAEIRRHTGQGQSGTNVPEPTPPAANR